MQACNAAVKREKIQSIFARQRESNKKTNKLMNLFFCGEQVKWKKKINTNLGIKKRKEAQK